MKHWRTYCEICHEGTTTKYSPCVNTNMERAIKNIDVASESGLSIIFNIQFNNNKRKTKKIIKPPLGVCLEQ
jgi:hypothetical protein